VGPDDIGLTRKQIHEARKVRDAEKARPGTVKKALEDKLSAGQEPTRADVKRAISAGAPQNKPKRKVAKSKAVKERQDRIVAFSDSGMTSKEIAVETGSIERVVHRVLEVENARREAQAQIDPSTLSMTAQERLETAIRQHKRKLDLGFEVQVLEECKRRLDEVSLPSYAKKLSELERSIQIRKGVMDRLTYKKILACLHPDRVREPALKKRYEEAFRLFTEMEKRVLNEKESPTQFKEMPRTYEDLMKMKAKVAAERKARRTAGKSEMRVR
jgi:hypothetical protein